ncbi:MAG: hypothetical protein F7B60_03860 [Desulfurococcales archaeon]|nr:hypothetical protein [Desulfurococcales archaeon]
MRKVWGLLAIILVLLTVTSNIIPVYSVTGYKRVVTRSIDVAAVLAEGEQGGEEVGVLSRLVVTVAYPGSGNVYVSTNPLTMLDTQAAARIAAMVAARMAGVDFWKYDYFYEMKSDSIIVGGPSASAAMTALTLACILDTPVRNDTVVTGMINPDGTVGPVGGLEGKLHAVATRDKVFVIPVGQRNYTYIIYEEEKLPFGFVVYRPVRKTVDLVRLGEKLGVTVIEASDIEQVYYYLTGKHLASSELPPSQYYEGEFKQISNLLEKRYEQLNATYSGIVTKASSNVRKYAEKLYAQSQELYNESVTAPVTYGLYLLVEAGASLEKANALINASLNDWAVTGLVQYVYNSINQTMSIVNKCNQPCTPFTVEFKTYLASLAEDSFNMFKSAVSQLSNRSGKLYLPVSIFGTVAITPLYTLVDAHWKIVLADMLYTALSSYEENPPSTGRLVTSNDVRRVAIEEIEIARSMQGYAVSLANELGVQPSSLVKALQFFSNATTDLNSGKYFSSLSYSMLAIEYSTISFIEMFGLKGQLYIPSLDKMIQNELSWCLSNYTLPIASYMLYTISKSLIDNGQTETGYMLMEKSMLYASLYTLLSRGETLQNTTTSTTSTKLKQNETSTGIITITITRTQGTTVTSIKTMTQTPGGSQTLGAAIVFAAVILVFIIGYAIGKLGKS